MRILPQFGLPRMTLPTGVPLRGQQAARGKVTMVTARGHH